MGSNKNRPFSTPHFLQRSLLVLTLTSVIAACSPTSPGSGGGGSGGSSGKYIFITGNWEFTLTPASGFSPLTALSGFVNEQGDDPGVDDFTTATVQVQSSTCYSDSKNMSLSGAVTGSHVGLSSFPVDGQVFSISASKDATSSHIAGTYSIAGGCANGETGVIDGTLYAPVTGTYLGTSPGAIADNLQLKLSQYMQGAADGTIFVTGSAVFEGVSCFTKGTLADSNGYVSGSTIHLAFSTNEATASTVVMSGTFDPTAKTLSLASIVVLGGNCSGTIGATTLSLQ